MSKKQVVQDARKVERIFNPCDAKGPGKGDNCVAPRGHWDPYHYGPTEDGLRWCWYVDGDAFLMPADDPAALQEARANHAAHAHFGLLDDDDPEPDEGVGLK